MKPLVILSDLDAIVANLSAKWYPAINKLAGFEAVTDDNVNQWDIGKLVPSVPEKDVFDIIKQPGFYRDLTLVPGGREALKELSRLRQPDNTPWFDIYFLSAAHVSPYAPMDKILWVEEHFPFIGQKKVITTYYKELVKGDILIDDGPHNIVKYREAWPDALTVTIDYPYNRTIDVADHLDFRAMDYTNTKMAWAAITYFLIGHALVRGMMPKDRKALEHRIENLEKMGVRR